MPSLKIWPTSIAVSKRSRPPQFGQVSPSADSRRSAKRASKSRPASTPRRCQPSRFAPATNCPLAQRLVGDDLALEADRAERAAARAEGRADLVVGRRARLAAERCIELRRLDSVVAADQGEHDRATVDGHRHRLRGRGDIDREELRQRLARLDAGRLDLGRRAPSVSGNAGARGTPRATSMSAAKSPFSQVTSVFSPAPAGARKSTDSLPPIIPDSASTS